MNTGIDTRMAQVHQARYLSQTACQRSHGKGLPRWGESSGTRALSVQEAHWIGDQLEIWILGGSGAMETAQLASRLDEVVSEIQRRGNELRNIPNYS